MQKHAKAREITKCFAVCTVEDRAVTSCRFRPKTRKMPPMVAVGKGVYMHAVLAGTMHLPDVTMEIWQTETFTHCTPIESVFDVPLLPVFLVYPVIFRAITTSQLDNLPTVGRLRRAMCDHLIQHAGFQPGDDDDEDEPAAAADVSMVARSDADDEDAAAMSELDDDDIDGEDNDDGDEEDDDDDVDDVDPDAKVDDEEDDVEPDSDLDESLPMGDDDEDAVFIPKAKAKKQHKRK